MTVWNARFKFPDANAADRPEVNTLVIFVEALVETATVPVADEDDKNMSAALPCTIIKPSEVEPAGRVDVVKARRLGAASVRYRVDNERL